MTLEWRDDIALITIDDGKANALSPDVIAALNEALDQIQAGERASRAVVICGRKGVFSGGFDLEVMRSGDLEAIGALVTSGGELVARLLGSPRPIVCACTGHAIAAGALLALGCHFRVGGDGDYRLGLTETAIGLVLPDWAVVIAEERLSRTELQRATVEARIYSPAEAKDAGFLDVVVPPDQVLDVALEEAKRLAALDPGAYSGTLAKLRGPCLDRLNAAVASGR